jgi:NAD-dependent deacetylase
VPLKPDGVFFGEQIPSSAVERARIAVQSCKIMIIIGSSGLVYPAAEIPFPSASKGATIIEINVDPTPFTTSVSGYFPEGKASLVLSGILDELRLSILP